MKMPLATSRVDLERLCNSPHVLQILLPLAMEVRRRKEHPFFKYRPDNHPLANQEAFHRSKATVRLVFGGNQAGKSRSVAQECAWWLMGEHPYQKVPKAARIYVISADYRTLQEGVWRHLKDLLPEWEIQRVSREVASYQVPYFVKMKNGAQIDFISGDGGNEARKKLQAAEINLAVLDEEVDGSLWGELQARRLARGGRVIIAATLYLSDPWILALEDRAESGDPDYHVVRLSTLRAVERGHVRASVVKEIEATQSAEDIAVRIHGQSRRHHGLVYPAFGAKNICEDFDIPKDWTRYCALDPGWDTFAIVWAAVSPSGAVVIYREVYEHSRRALEMLDIVFAREGWRQKGVIGVNPKFLGNPHVADLEHVWVPDPPRTEKVEIHWIDPASFGHQDSGEPKTAHLLAERGLSCAPARNDVDLGIELVRGAMETSIGDVPRLRIFRSCVNLVKELRALRWKRPSQNSNIPTRKPVPVGADHAADCFVRGTLIGTVDGEIPVERIAAGDLVHTRSGLRPVLAAWETGERDLWSLSLEDGRSLVGTGTHPIWVDGQGWKNLAEVTAGDTILSWEARRSSGTESASVDTRSRSVERIGSTSPREARTASVASSASTRRSGARRTERSPADTTSIIATATRSITLSRISSACREPSIYRITESHLAGQNHKRTRNFSAASDHSPRNGIGRRPEESGIASTRERYGKTPRCESSPATSAGRDSRAPLDGRDSARMPARPASASSPGWITSGERARSAADRSSAIAFSESALARVRVARVSPLGRRAPVYNLQVAGTPEYFANGVLVHNCLRYLFAGGLQHVPDSQKTIHELIESATCGMAERYAEDLAKVIRRQGGSNQAAYAHPAGLGVHY